jgi:hypothetical protein
MSDTNTWSGGDPSNDPFTPDQIDNAVARLLRPDTPSAPNAQLVRTVAAAYTLPQAADAALARSRVTLARQAEALGRGAYLSGGHPMISSDTRPASTGPSTTPPQPPRRRLSSFEAFLRTAAAVLVVGLLVGGFYAVLHHAPRQGTQPHPTPTPNANDTATPTVGAQSPMWTSVTNLPSVTEDLRFAPSDPSIAYVCAEDGPAQGALAHTWQLYKSTDDARSWQAVATAPVFPTNITGNVNGVPVIPGCTVFVDAAEANDVFLQETVLSPVGATTGVARALYRSRDGGVTWHTLGELDQTIGFETLAVVGSRLIARPGFNVNGASTCDPSKQLKPASTVYASDDGGLTWHDLGTAIESQGYSPVDFAAWGSTVVLEASQVPAQACLMTLPPSGIWRSTDGGTTWARASLPAGMSVGGLVLYPKAGASSAYGLSLGQPTASGSLPPVPLYSSDSGATWSQLPEIANAATEFIDFDGMAATPGGTVYLDTGQAGNEPSYHVYVLRLSDPSPTWQIYAPGALGPLQFVTGPGSGSTFWVVSPDYPSQAAVQYLAVP